MSDIINWVTTNWISIVAALWALEKLIEAISVLTKTKIDDNVGIWLGKILSRFFPQK